MSLCCCSAGSRRLLLPRLFLGQRRHVRRPLLHLRTTATTAAASSSTTSLSSQQQRQISLYVDALLDWNQRMNLTAVTEEAEVMTRHVVDSLAVLPPLERAYTSRGGDIAGISLVDVGSGAGLPGLILAVARPSWKFTLLESMRKRCTFLEHAVEIMELSNVDVVCDRAENAGQSHDFRESFDVAAARAVAELKILAEYCLPLVRVGGLFIAAKGHDPHEEIRSAKAAVGKLGASMLDLCNVESMGPHGQRTAVVYLKERTTPKKYPRQPDTECLEQIQNVVWGICIRGVLRVGRRIFCEPSDVTLSCGSVASSTFATELVLQKSCNRGLVTEIFATNVLLQKTFVTMLLLQKNLFATSDRTVNYCNRDNVAETFATEVMLQIIFATKIMLQIFFATEIMLRKRL